MSYSLEIEGLVSRIHKLEAALSTETQRRERFEEDVESLHMWLDRHGVPRADTGGEVFSLVGRVMRFAGT